MPQYIYRCDNCLFEFERNLPIDERLLPTFMVCPSCSKLCINKLISSFAFKIKGYSSKNGFSKDVGDIEKHLGRELNNNDLDD